MATYTYKCKDADCGFVTEHIQSMKDPLPDTIKCQKCGKDSEIAILTAPAVATSGMSNAPIDVVVGRDASARWADIAHRQELRNKVRRESGQEAVRMVGRNKFEAIPGAERVAVEAPNSGRDDD